MSLGDWTAADGAKAREKMGPVEWEALDAFAGEMLRLEFCDCDQLGKHFIRRLFRDGVPEDRDQPLATRPALCLLREHAREWLEERGVSVIPSDWNFEPGFCAALYSMDLEAGDSAWSYRAECFRTDYDAALVAAVLAVKEPHE